MTKWLTSLLEDCEHHLSFRLKPSSSCHLCSMKPLLPRTCVTLELEGEREAACRRSFCKSNCNAEKARCWPEGEKRWYCGETGGLEQAQCAQVTYSEPWHIQDHIFKPSYPKCGPSGTVDVRPPGLMKSNHSWEATRKIWGDSWAFTI